MRWPGTGPTSWSDCAADYDRTVDALLTAGVMLDRQMVHWYARLSPSYPTVEVRVNDVCTDVDDTVLTAALIRAAVATAITDIGAGHHATRSPDCVTAAAHWRAARDGLTHTLVDHGDGAHRQREAYHRTGDLRTMLAGLAARTTAAQPPDARVSLTAGRALGAHA